MGKNVYKWIAWLCLAVGLWFVLTLILIAIQGDEWSWLITVNNPKRRMLAAFVALVGWTFMGGGASPLNEWRAKLGRLVLLCASLGTSVLAGEVALRAMLDRNQGRGGLHDLADGGKTRRITARTFHPLSVIVRLSANKLLVYELMPNLDMTFGHRSLRTNREGMRSSREYEREKPPGTFRIVGVGDSGMFGWNVHQGEDYMAVLEGLLNRRNDGTTYEALNFGVPGYNTGQELAMLRDRGLAFEPDVVLVGWCDNDFGFPFFMLAPVDFKRRDVLFLYHLAFNRPSFRKLVDPQALRGAEVDHERVDPAIAGYTGADGVRKAFSEMQELARERGFRLLVFGPMNVHVRGIADELGLEYFNTHDRIPRGKYPSDYAVHFMHPSAEGHRVLAEELAAFFGAEGWLPTQP